MSGDVQPRKRRDKKKKKDDAEETTAHQHFARAPTPPSTSDDVNIHIYKESSTGGGICAKFVFFILLGALAVLIGLIITEHRGLTDLDTIESETRFSQIFEGWVDKSASTHDDHDDHAIESHEHDEEHGDDHEEEEHDDEKEEEHSDEAAASEEEEEEHSVDEEEQSVEEDDQSVDEDEQSVDDEDQSVDESVQEDELSVEEDEDEPSAQEDEDEPSAQEDEDEPSAQEDEDEPSAQEDEDEPSAQDDDDDDEPSAQDDEDEDVQSNEEAKESVENDDSVQDEGSDQIDEDGTQSKEAEEVKESEEKSTETDANLEEEEPIEGDEDQANVGVSIKFGVGVAILVVAYVVLVRKWKSDKLNEEQPAVKKEASVDLTRRNTIVMPPKVEEVEQVIENYDEEYSDEEVEDEVKLHPQVKQSYQQLRSTYERSLTPESETEGKAYEEDYEDDEEGEVDDDVEYDEEVADEEEEIEDLEEEEEEQISEVDDEDLMKKLEAKYGKLRDDDDDEEDYEDEEEEEEDDDYQWKRDKPTQDFESDDENKAKHHSGAQAIYDFDNITSSLDYEIKDQLDDADAQIINNAALAVSLFNKILEMYPKSPRALYGKAKSLDSLAETRRSNELLRESIAFYLEVLKSRSVPDALFEIVAERCINRMRFIGQHGRAVTIHKLLIGRFPNEIKYRNQLAVTYLTMNNRMSEANELLRNTLKKWPNDGFALVHYGFIIKVNENKLKESVKYLKKGLATKDEGVIDGRFYFHLGDALTRLGKHDEATQVFKEGVHNKVFLSRYQRSLYNVKKLTGRPWWNKEQLPQYKKFYDLLENNFKQIRHEGLAVMNQKGFFQDEAENLRDVGDWKQFELFARGIKHKQNCLKCPVTCKLVESMPDAVGCRRGQIKFSVMHPGTHVWPHCGPTNCRLRVHLGLKVPPKTYIRVAEEIRSWEEGKIFIFDDSFEHEVWHNGTEFRLVLIVDVWHPELTTNEKRSLSAI